MKSLINEVVQASDSAVRLSYIALPFAIYFRDIFLLLRSKMTRKTRSLTPGPQSLPIFGSLLGLRAARCGSAKFAYFGLGIKLHTKIHS